MRKILKDKRCTSGANKSKFNKRTMRKQILYTLINFIVMLIIFMGVTATVFVVTDESYVTEIDYDIIKIASELMGLPMQEEGSPRLLPSVYVAYYNVFGDYISGYGNADNILNLPGQRYLGDKLDRCYGIKLQNSRYRVYSVQCSNKYADKKDIFYVKVMRNIDGMNIAYKKLADGLMMYLPLGALGLLSISIILAIAQIRPYKFALDNSLTFTSDVSHELNTPLTIIKANIESIINEGGERSEDEYKQLITCLSETNRLRRLTKQLLLLSRSDNHRLVVAPEACNIRSVVENICEPYSFTAVDQLKIFSINIKSSCNGSFMIDKDLFSQVLIALLDNAIKYTKMGESITVEMSVTRDKLNLTIRDSGKGVNDDELEKIFLRFYRSDTSRTTVGTGLGLPIVQAIINALQGKVLATNIRPHGFGIYITLPILRAEIG